MAENQAAAPLGHRAKSLARKFALLGLYEWQVNPASSPEKLADVVSNFFKEGEPESGDLTPEEFDKCDQELFRTLLMEAIEHRETLEAAVSKHLNRPLSQVSAVERAILLLGATELAYHPETAFIVVLDEMVELAKQFGSAGKGYRFVNGVLDKVARELRPEETAAAKKGAKA